MRFALVTLMLAACSSSYGDGTQAPLSPDHDDGGSDDGGSAAADSGADPDASSDASPQADAADASLTCSGPACERMVFVSSSTGDGNQGGAAGADKECQELADVGSKTRGHKFKAWMSETGSTVVDRLVHGTKPYLRVDGVVVANDWDDLVSGSIRAPINTDENGTVVGLASVWTATRANGSLVATPCANWASSSGNARTGSTGKIDGNWTDDTDRTCGSALRIYCIEN